MKLSDLICDIEYTSAAGGALIDNTDIEAICYDTRKLSKGCLFICIKGAKWDSHNSITEAVEKGAAAIIIEHEVEDCVDVPLLKVDSSRKALAYISSAWFGKPSSKLTTIAITGTKGKSTSAYMVRNILEACGHKTGIMGTIGVGIADKVYPLNNTTPEPYLLHMYLKQMVDEGCDSLVMEVSSQAMKQFRVEGIDYDYALFTNLEADHIGADEHASFEEYIYCKSLLFRQTKLAAGYAGDEHFEAVVCGKTEVFPEIAPAAATTCKIERFGFDTEFEVYASNVKLLGEGGNIGIGYTAVMDGDALNVELSIPGRFNVNNSLGALAICRHILKEDAGIDLVRYKELLSIASKALHDTHVKGRLEPLNISSRFSLMIDYAHNAMALESLLTTLKEHNPKRLVCLFGCGGNRSKDRRYEMGEVSSRLADLTIVTSDNPRFEKPEDIIADILTGVEKANGDYIIIVDRREAIRYAIEYAQDGDVIILAGKGQEDYQEIEGVKYHMDEREIVADAVEALMAERGYI